MAFPTRSTDQCASFDLCNHVSYASPTSFAPTQEHAPQEQLCSREKGSEHQFDGLAEAAGLLGAQRLASQLAAHGMAFISHAHHRQHGVLWAAPQHLLLETMKVPHNSATSNWRLVPPELQVWAYHGISCDGNTASGLFDGKMFDRGVAHADHMHRPCHGPH